MAVRLAINGFGRIGRAALKIALEKTEIEVVAINDLADVKINAHLLTYDTVYGHYEKEVSVEEGGVVVASEGITPSYEYFEGDKSEEAFLLIDDQRIAYFSESDPAKLPWEKLGVDVVLECTGMFTEYEKAKAHLIAGAGKVVISAPGKGIGKTLVFGTESLKHEITDDVVSNASCTTNCISPVGQILEENFGVQKSWMTTIHSYTSSQNLVDGSHKKDLRRARAAAANIVPTSTGATKAAAEAVPSLANKFEGAAVRVPTINGSLAIITSLLKKKTTVEEVNETFKSMSNSESYKGILDVSVEPLVSSDFINNSHSAIIDLELTNLIDGDFLTVFAWYDNEWGYANRLVEMGEFLGGLKSKQQ
jgi:glyceraldehyde 3-phosphate dehydrogenase